MQRLAARQVLGIAGGLALGVLVAVAVVWHRQPPRVAPYRLALSPAALRRVDGFTISSVGPRLDRISPSGNEVERTGDRVDLVRLEYGDCVLRGGDEPGCVYPLVLQSSRRSGSTQSSPRRVKRFGARIEVTTPSTRLVIWARDARLAEDALAGLQPVNGG